MKKSINIIFIVFVLALLAACQVKFWPDTDHDKGELDIKVERYDRLQSRYLTTGDFAAIQSMNTTYPIQTRTLIEDMLHLGTVDQHNINERFLKFYQDTTLQAIIAEAELQYANIDDINSDLSKSFARLKREIPEMNIPEFYTQIGALDQSIIIGDGIIGISLDKYLGENYQVYMRFYPENQRKTMNRANIVPDCLTFYLLSLFPLQNFETASQEVRDIHIGRIMYVANKALGQQFFKTQYVTEAQKVIKKNKKLTIKQLLSGNIQ